MNGVVRGQRWWRRVIVAALFMLAGALCAWAVITVLEPAEDPLEAAPATYVTVAEGEVGESLALNAIAEWPREPIGTNRASGIVTDVAVADGDLVGTGQELYSVDLRPVVIAEGDVPAFRSIGPGADGEDVAQLQRMLSELGHYDSEVDGHAGPGTVRAIESWQEELGIASTGVVDAGDVIFVPTVPIHVTLDREAVHRGMTLSGGEEVVRGLPAAPSFRIPATESQAAMIATGTRVDVTAPQGELWTAVVAEQQHEEGTETVSLILEGDDGAPVCDDACEQIGVSGQTSLASKIVLTEEVSGLVVPSSALVTAADGDLAVIDRDGRRHPVTVEASANGMSVITGVDAGAAVRVPAGAGASG